MIEKYEALAGPLADVVVGVTTADISRDRNAAGESALGKVVTDSHLAATKSAATGGAVVAFMNSGGIRADIMYASSGAEADGGLTYGEAFGVHPFGNSLVTMSLTGAQIDALLESQFGDPSSDSNNILQVSAGFRYMWDASRPAGSKVDDGSITINGNVVDPDATYRVTVNSFLADGGSGFSVLTAGTDRPGRRSRSGCSSRLLCNCLSSGPRSGGPHPSL